MLNRFLKSLAIVTLLTGAAHAQIIPGDSPNSGVGAAVANSRGLGIVSRPHTWQGYGSESSYNETVKRIPDKKASNDPWKNVRQAPPDRHRVE
jgi:hypothetical protein